MQLGLTSILKVTLILMVAFFIVKLATKAIATKFPNAITGAIDNVVQAA